ncbi:MAG TPA: hypothetical protein VMG62_03035 [Solirubrobacteraceae bacterium]|nr:hypothetical protein [Solirubrobacteraceae bacterium]
MPSVKLVFTTPDGKDHDVELSADAIEALAEIANRNKQSLDTALHQALVNENRIENALEGDGELLLKKGHQVQELFYEPA